MEKPVRVLHLVRKMDFGGVQSMIMNYYRNIDRKKVQFDFIVQGKEEGFYDNEIRSLGGSIYYVKSIKNLICYYIDIYKVLKQNDYKIVHVHQNFANIHGLLLSLINGVPNRISHSHNSYPESSLFRRLIKKIIQYTINKLSTNKFACSIIAADWLYGERQRANGNISVINNAIDTKKFIFEDLTRQRKRLELNVSDKILIGHIGNFSEQKNHEFLIDIFYEIYKIQTKAHLILVGQGELEGKVKRKVESMGLTGHVSFLGKRSDINELLNAFDIFLFPSLYEGLPVVIVEAQSTGLKCIISDEISKEIAISSLVTFVELGRPASEWAKLVLDKLENYSRGDMEYVIQENGYDIFQESKKLQDFYINAN
jgi:glycosyltransferase involved in cell wall biosynthesis